MNCEIDFIGIKEHTKDASAVCLRWYSEQAKRYIVIVYDGGFKIHGEGLVGHLKQYYFPDDFTPGFVSIGKDSDHPKAMVTNAYIRRGVKVYEARTSTIHHHKGEMPERKGWTSATKIDFSIEVDDWD